MHRWLRRMDAPAHATTVGLYSVPCFLGGGPQTMASFLSFASFPRIQSPVFFPHLKTVHSSRAGWSWEGSGSVVLLKGCYMGSATTGLQTFGLRQLVYRHLVYRHLVYYHTLA